MRNKYKSVSFLPAALHWLAEFVLKRKTEQKQMLLKSTKLSENIYNDLIQNSSILDNASLTIPQNINALKADIFTSLYSPAIFRNTYDEISLKERLYNQPILDIFLKNDRFEKLKDLCENKALISYEAADTFCKCLLEKLSDSAKALIGTRYIQVINKLNGQIDKSIHSLRHVHAVGGTMSDEKKLKIINRIYNKSEQIENLIKKLEREALCLSQSQILDLSEAINAALEAAKSIQLILSAFGSEEGMPERMKLDRELISRVKSNKELAAVTRMLGRYKEIIAQKRKNSFAFGLGEKYDITSGNNIAGCLSSELALLGTKETELLFIRKYEQKRLMQYRKRDPIVKGAGDMIVLIDESDSTRGIAGWIKAFALAMLDIAAKDKRKFALIQFSSKYQVKTDTFEPMKYKSEDILAAAEQFFGGGTDFETPLKEALSLMRNGYEKADITIITDGQCTLSEEFCKELKSKLQNYKALVTGILLNKNGECGESLIPFCDRVYSSKDLSEDEIALEILNNKVY